MNAIINCGIRIFPYCHCERSAAIQGAVNTRPTFLWIATADKQPRDDKKNPKP